MRLATAALVLALASPGIGVAGDCDALRGQTIRWLVPSQPGGGYDAYSRLLQPFVEQALEARLVIENRPEAGGVVGAVMLRDAKPDGRTLGLINAAGLLAAQVSAAGAAPDPAEDFTVLARVVANRMMLFTGRESGISNMDDLLRVSAARPVVVGVRDAGSSSFFVFPMTARLLGLDYSLVTGYVGSTSRVLASLRGEVDVILQTLDSVMPYVESGELVPLLWVTDPPGARQLQDLPFKAPVLADLDLHPHAPGGDSPEHAGGPGLEAAAISSILSAGRVIAAPSGLAPEPKTCLQDVLAAVLRSPGLEQAAKAAGLSLEPAGAGQALEELETSRHFVEQFAPMMRAAIEEARQ